MKERGEKVGKNDIAQKLLIGVTMLMIGGSPGYFLIGPNKPNREDVKNMIDDRVPLILAPAIEEIKKNTNSIITKQAVMEAHLSSIIDAIKERD